MFSWPGFHKGLEDKRKLITISSGADLLPRLLGTENPSSRPTFRLQGWSSWVACYVAPIVWLPTQITAETWGPCGSSPLIKGCTKSTITAELGGGAEILQSLAITKFPWPVLSIQETSPNFMRWRPTWVDKRQITLTSLSRRQQVTIDYRVTWL